MRFPKNGTDYLTPLSLSNSGATRSSHENKRELHPPRAAFFVTGGEGNLRTGLHGGTQLHGGAQLDDGLTWMDEAGDGFSSACGEQQGLLPAGFGDGELAFR